MTGRLRTVAKYLMPHGVRNVREQRRARAFEADRTRHDGRVAVFGRR